LWGLSAWLSIKGLAHVPTTDNKSLIIVSQKMGTKHEISIWVRELICRGGVEEPSNVKSWKPTERVSRRNYLIILNSSKGPKRIHWVH